MNSGAAMPSIDYEPGWEEFRSDGCLYFCMRFGIPDGAGGFEWQTVCIEIQCIGKPTPIRWLPETHPVKIKIEGETPDWLDDVHAFAALHRAVAMAPDRMAEGLKESLLKAYKELNERLPEGFSVNVHEHSPA